MTTEYSVQSPSAPQWGTVRSDVTLTMGHNNFLLRNNYSQQPSPLSTRRNPSEIRTNKVTIVGNVETYAGFSNIPPKSNRRSYSARSYQSSPNFSHPNSGRTSNKYAQLTTKDIEGSLYLGHNIMHKSKENALRKNITPRRLFSKTNEKSPNQRSASLERNKNAVEQAAFSSKYENSVQNPPNINSTDTSRPNFAVPDQISDTFEITVQNSKQELEQLKADLEQLIKSNISKKIDPPNIANDDTKDENTDSLKENENVNKKDTKPKLSAKSNKMPSSEATKSETPKKVKHYDVKSAREWMKKQKVLRQNKLQEENNFKRTMQEERRRKLRELQDKTMKMIYQSKVRRNKTESLKNTIETNNENEPPQNIQVVNEAKNIQIEKDEKKYAIPSLVTPQCQLTTKTLPDWEIRNKAAIKIQAAFRGYKERKLYQLKLQITKSFVEEKAKTNTPSKPEEVPVWLQPAPPLPYPYNFITAVKQKLNYILYGQQNNAKNDQSLPYDSTFLSDSSLQLDFNAQNHENHEEVSSSRTSSKVSSKSIKLPLEYPKKYLSSDSISTVEHRSSSQRQSLVDEVKSIKAASKPQDNIKNLLSLSITSIDTDISSTTPRNIPSPGANSTGNDIESAILSASTSRKSPTKSSESINERISIKQNGNGYSNNTFTTVTTESLVAELSRKINESLKSTTSSPSYHLTAAQALEKPTNRLVLKGTSNERNATVQNENFTVFCNVNDTKIERKDKANDNEQKIHLTFEANLKMMNEFPEALMKLAAKNEELIQHCKCRSEEVHHKNSHSQSSTRSHSKSSTITSEINNENEEKSIETNKTLAISPKRLSNSNTDSEIVEVLKSGRKLNAINYVRGSNLNCSSDLNVSKNRKSHTNSSAVSTSIDINKLGDSFSNSSTSKNTTHASDLSRFSVNSEIQGLSIEMIDQQIRNEDLQLEHFKTLLKIREKALVDRTKGELAWLELTKKQYREQGNISQASAVKKKQRGLILKLQQEKHEMQRLKQMHKASCEERKVMLKEQKNIIKKQLSTKKMLTQFKRTQKEIANRNGPMKVYNVHAQNDSIVASSMEAPSSKRSHSISISEEVIHTQTTRRSHVVNSPTTDGGASSEIETVGYHRKRVVVHTNQIPDPEKLKNSLRKREEELKKRRTRAEELIQWHRRLSEEEQRVAALENEAKQVVQVQSKEKTNIGSPTEYKLKGSQLNNLWYNITRVKVQKYEPQKIYIMTRTELNQFYDLAKQHVIDKIETLDLSRMSDENTITSESFRRSSSKHDEEASEKYTSIPTMSSQDKSSVSEEIDSIKNTENGEVNMEVLENLDSSIRSEVIASEKSTRKTSISEKVSVEENSEVVESVVENHEPENVERSESEMDEANSNRSSCTSISFDFSEKIVTLEDNDCESSDAFNLISASDLTKKFETVSNDSSKIETNVSAKSSSLSIELEIETVDDVVASDKSIKEEKLEDEQNRQVEEIENLEDSDLKANEIEEKSIESNIETKSTESEILTEKIENEIETERDEKTVESESSKEIDSGSKSIETEPETSREAPEKNDFSESKSSESPVDVRKRINEILNETNNVSKSNSPRMQDLWVTTYDVPSLIETNLEKMSENETKLVFKSANQEIVNEAEELLKKQIEIELEIKELEKQQRSDVVPYMFVREIPNKPPPPYTPPQFTVISPPKPPEKYVLPQSVEQIRPLVSAATEYLYQAYLDNNLKNLTATDVFMKSDNEIKTSYDHFLFDLCKEVALDALKITSVLNQTKSSWLRPRNLRKPMPPVPQSKEEFLRVVETRVNEYFGFVTKEKRDSSLICWSRKKRDPVDEILVQESQAEESEWTNFDEDEATVKNELTMDIFNLLLDDTIAAVQKTVTRKYNKLNCK